MFLLKWCLLTLLLLSLLLSLLAAGVVWERWECAEQAAVLQVCHFTGATEDQCNRWHLLPLLVDVVLLLHFLLNFLFLFLFLLLFLLQVLLLPAIILQKVGTRYSVQSTKLSIQAHPHWRRLAKQPWERYMIRSELCRLKLLFQIQANIYLYLWLIYMYNILHVCVFCCNVLFPSTYPVHGRPLSVRYRAGAQRPETIADDARWLP